MIINRQNLDAIRVGFKTSFQQGLGQAPSMRDRIATTVPSSTKEEKYGWLGKIPNVREWIGPRQVQNLMEHDYAIKNKHWELTIGVDRDDIEDDTLGIYAPLFTEMGRSTGAHADQLVFGLLKNGFATNCYDGQFFFDTDHPVLDETGMAQPVANTDGGSGTPWFLIDGSRALKPIIYQLRKDWQFVPKDDERDDNVFSNREFVYGADAHERWLRLLADGLGLEADARCDPLRHGAHRAHRHEGRFRQAARADAEHADRAACARGGRPQAAQQRVCVGRRDQPVERHRRAARRAVAGVSVTALK